MNMRDRITLIDINEKFIKGENITTPELLKLRDFYLRLSTDLTVLENQFGLARQEAMRRLARLNDYISARGLTTKEVQT